MPQTGTFKIKEIELEVRLERSDGKLSRYVLRGGRCGDVCSPTRQPNSYGFRPGRSPQDAIEAIHTIIAQKARYVLDADISKCFDKIRHSPLLEKLNTFPTRRRHLRAWLKAGVMDKGAFSETAEGTPQGGVISPLLANIALHGMENRINQAFPWKQVKHKGKYIGVQSQAQLIRFADDFVILHEDLTVVQRCQQIISEWLQGMGLELKPSKTR